MEFTTFARRPFTVQAVEVTTENIKEIAKLVGKVKYKEDDGTPYIEVDKNRVPNLSYVYPGFWMTKLGKQVRCYSRKIFQEQFVELTDDVDAWVRYMNGEEISEEADDSEVAEVSG